tara:strand:- start:1822 stop:3084 length:1263 start_codon:yes stop_codon:yes gene_type:complete
MSKRRSAESIAASLMVKPEINVGQTPDWLDSLAELPEVVEKARVRNVRQVKANINLLPELSSLIRDDSSLESYEKVAENLATNAEGNKELAIYAPVIRGSAANLREDYNIFTNSMEQSAKMLNDKSFLDTQEEFVNLTENFKNYKDDKGNQKYQNVIEFLTSESERVGTLIGRIESIGKDRQFRYNKNANYTDQEIINKLKSYENRIGTAIQTALGDGIINMDEAEFIMAGDVKSYNRFKKDRVSLITNQYKNINRVQEKIRNQILSLDQKSLNDSDANMIAKIFTQEILATGGEEMDGVEVTGTTKEQIKAQLKSLNTGLASQKQQIKDAYQYWEGRPYFHKTKTNKEDLKSLMENIVINDGNNASDPVKKNKKNNTPIVPKKLSNKEVKQMWKKLSREEKAKYGSRRKYRDYLHKQQG